MSTDGIRPGGFTAVNAAEKAKQAELTKKLSEDAIMARHTGEDEWAGQIQDQKRALEDDTLVSTTALRQQGEAAGWGDQRMNDALARHDQGDKGVVSEDEFDLIAAEMEPEKPKGYEVKPGDSLSAMTAATGRDPSRYQELYEHNKDVVGADPNLIHPGQQLEKPPGWVIEDAAISPDKPTHQVPDRAEELIKADRLNDAETLGQAKQALEEVPADNPRRAEYEQKVKDLEAAYEAKWNPPAEAPAEQPPAGGATEEAPAEEPKKDVDPKIAAGEQKAVEEAIDAADGDKGKLKELAEALPKDDPRAKALLAVADGAVNDEVAEHVLNALKDQDSTRGDIADALQASDGDKAAIEAIGAVAAYKATIQEDADVKAEMEALATSMDAMAKAGDAVRKELALGFDASGNLEDYERATDAARSKEDLEAIKAFVDHKRASEKDTGVDTFAGFDPGPRLDAAIANWDAIEAVPGAVEHVGNLLQDGRDDKEDLVKAGLATGDANALKALARIAESVGEYDTAANLLELTDAKYAGAAEGTRKAVLER